MKLSMIYARSENRCIGQAGRLPWRLPDEFAHFKRTTFGHPVVMGRRTFEDHSSILPGRTNIVLTRNRGFGVDGLVMRPSLDEALEPYRDTDEEVFVIGGADLFAVGYGVVDRVYETVVHAEVDGDTFLPDFDFSGWETRVLEEHQADDHHPHAFTIYRHDRRSTA